MNRTYYKMRAGDMSPDYLNGVREVFTERQYLAPRQYKNISRYKNIRRLMDEDTKKIYHENWIQKYVDYSKSDIYHIVDIQDAGRLDIIAQLYYGTPRYWWVIALANAIKDPFDIPVGTSLRVPDILSLYNRGGILSDG